MVVYPPIIDSPRRPGKSHACARARCARARSARAGCRPRSRRRPGASPATRASSPRRRADARSVASASRKTRLSCSVMRVMPVRGGVIRASLRVGPGRRCVLHRAQRLLRRRGVRARQGPGHQPALAGAQRASGRRRLAESIVGRLDRYLSVTQFGITLASLGLGWIGEPAMAALLDRAAVSRHRHARLPRGCTSSSTAVAFAILTFAHVLFGELVPKLVAIQRSEGTAVAAAIPLRLIYVTFLPLLWLLERSSRIILRMRSGCRPTSASVEGRFSEDEILAILAASAARSPRGKALARALRTRDALLAARRAPLDGAACRRRVAPRADERRRGATLRAHASVFARPAHQRALARRRCRLPLREGLPPPLRRVDHRTISRPSGATSSSFPRSRAAST